MLVLLTASTGFITRLENWAIGRQFTRRDGDPKRLAAFRATMDRVHAEYWVKKYPRNYHLQLLATHPDYRRRGAGSLLSQWGIKEAVTSGVAVGVEASPMGFLLYSQLGFKLKDTLTVQAEDDAETLAVKVMVYDKSKDQR